MPSPWEGDEAKWSHDGREVYVPLRPTSRQEVEPGAAAGKPADREGPTVTVYETGREGQEHAEPAEPHEDPRTALFRKIHNAALGAITVTSGAVRIVVPAKATPRPAIPRLSPSGQWLSYLSVFSPSDPHSQEIVYDLAVAPAKGGAVHILASHLPVADNPWGWTYRWHPSRDLLVYFKDRRLWLVNFSPGSRREPRQLAGDLGDLAPTPLAFTRDGTEVLVGTSPVDRHNYAGPRPTYLALVPLDGSKPRQYQVRGGALMADPQMLWQPKPGYLTLAARDSSTDETSFLRLDLKTGETLMLHNATGQINFVDSGQGPLVGLFENETTPPGFYQFADDFAERRRLTHIEPRLDRIGVRRVVSYETPVTRYDGKRIRAKASLLFPPGARPGERLPTIVFVYPGANLSTYSRRYAGGSPNGLPALLFTSRGYAVLLPDLPIGPEGAAGNPIRETTDVLLPQVFRAAELGYTDLQRVSLLGHSYGAYGAAGVVSQTNLFRAAVAISGMYDLPGPYARMDEGGTDFNATSFETGKERMGTHPWADLQRYLSNSPYYQADHIHTPLLLIHGDKDELWEEAAKMFNALQRLGRTAELAIYAGEGHLVRKWSPANAADACRRIVTFLDRYTMPEDGHKYAQSSD